ncbi:MAG: phytanoyl-CoA dioxygenase family protein [Planctomycetota bacterium]|nr:phytanoyl-CoA dioxygenase family protein [Planctomycetota bacterium]MDA1140128.1 phytanoyl-CoA dioxygenase family protein [Planctomycetota bacterium]
MFTQAKIQEFKERGHLTLPGLFSSSEIDAAIQDIHSWGNLILENLSERDKAWYLDRGVKNAEVLRKLDMPVFQRDVFRNLAHKKNLVSCVEQLIGKGVSVYFSQIFLKPPEGGGPKPVHQDNFYFGPDDPNGMVTVWIALDEATTENGCLYFGEGTQDGDVIKHIAPPDEPYNLQIPPETAIKAPMTPAPVPRGGVSFHHGSTFHQSSSNTSTKWRRAAAFHYARNDVRLVTPALPYDESQYVVVTSI